LLTLCSMNPLSDREPVITGVTELRVPAGGEAVAVQPMRAGHRIWTAAAVVIIIAGLKYAGPFLVPLVLGLMIAAVSSPLVTWLVRKGAPPVIGAAAVLALDIAALGGVARLLFLAASDLQGGLPTYIAKFSALSASIAHYLNRQGLHDVNTASLMQSGQAGAMVQGVLGNFATGASYMAIVVFVVFFALCEFSGIGDKLRTLTHNAEVQFERVDRIVRQVQLYLVVKIWTSLIAGVCAYIVLKLVGVELALLLALSLFLLHFIPNIGTAIATVPAVVFALADRGPAAAVTVGAAYLAINTLLGSLIEPRMLGTRLGVSPFVVLVGMLFWAWLWGPIGGLLSVPILAATKIVLENIPELAWLGELAGNTTTTIQSESETSPLRRHRKAGLGLGAAERGAVGPVVHTHSTGFRLRARLARARAAAAGQPKS
jgi:AI-2 transport protein TqsA